MTFEEHVTNFHGDADAAWIDYAANNYGCGAGRVYHRVDVNWLLQAGFRVFSMQAAFALLEAGTVRAEHVSAVMLKNLGDIILGSMAFWILGYGLAFAEIEYLALHPEEEADSNYVIPTLASPILPDLQSDAFFFFQYSFAATATTIVSGMIAERAVIRIYLAMVIFITGVIYPIAVYWTWGGGYLTKHWEFVDFAGSAIVHMTGGFAGLGYIMVMGSRTGYFAGLALQKQDELLTKRQEEIRKDDPEASTSYGGFRKMKRATSYGGHLGNNAMFFRARRSMGPRGGGTAFGSSGSRTPMGSQSLNMSTGMSTTFGLGRSFGSATDFGGTGSPPGGGTGLRQARSSSPHPDDVVSAANSEDEVANSAMQNALQASTSSNTPNKMGSKELAGSNTPQSKKSNQPSNVQSNHTPRTAKTESKDAGNNVVGITSKDVAVTMMENGLGGESPESGLNAGENTGSTVPALVARTTVSTAAPDGTPSTTAESNTQIKPEVSISKPEMSVSRKGSTESNKSGNKNFTRRVSASTNDDDGNPVMLPPTTKEDITEYNPRLTPKLRDMGSILNMHNANSEFQQDMKALDKIIYRERHLSEAFQCVRKLVQATQPKDRIEKTMRTVQALIDIKAPPRKASPHTIADCSYLLQNLHELGLIHERDLSTSMERKYPSSHVQILFGTLLLWVGWYGFNPGSTLGLLDDLDTQAAKVTMNTTFSAVGGGFMSVMWNIVYKNDEGGNTTVMQLCIGVLSGLVASCAGCHLFNTFGAFMVGCISFMVGTGFDNMLKHPRIGLDDPLAAFGIHGAAGFWGALAPAFFAAPHCTNGSVNELGVREGETLGLFYGGDLQFLLNQAFGAAMIGLWAFGASAGVMLLLTYGGFEVRCKLLAEILGADKEAQIEYEIKHNLNLKSAEAAICNYLVKKRKAENMRINMALLAEEVKGWQDSHPDASIRLARQQMKEQMKEKARKEYDAEKTNAPPSLANSMREDDLKKMAQDADRKNSAEELKRFNNSLKTRVDKSSTKENAGANAGATVGERCADNATELAATAGTEKKKEGEHSADEKDVEMELFEGKKEDEVEENEV